RLLVYATLVPLVIATITPPTSRGLAPEDSDLLSQSSTTWSSVKPRANGVPQNEVTSIAEEKSGWTTDDYSDFAKEPIRNGGANRNLKPRHISPDSENVRNTVARTRNGNSSACTSCSAHANSLSGTTATTATTTALRCSATSTTVFAKRLLLSALSVL
ncbi:hypothetical protein OSTOST_05192, partial [Ostertagia ostertagi]